MAASDNVPEGLRYSSEHQWVRLEESGAVVGATDYGQEQLGDLVYVDLAKPGSRVELSGALGELESTKVLYEFHAPIAGEVVEVNPALDRNPELINSDPYGKGWLVSIRPSDRGEIDQLLDAAGYREHLRREQGEA